MGLHAYVCCDCLEKGRLRSPANSEWQVFVDSDGSRNTRSSDLDVQIAFDQWSSTACEHELGKYANASIGNISLVGLLQGELNSSGLSFPVLLERVLYSGTHCGDSIPIDLMPQLRAEIDQLSRVHADERQNEKFLREFERTMRALSEHARMLGKPIVF